MSKTAKTTPARAILTPLIDAMCCGGLSIVGIGSFLIYASFLPPGTLARFDIEEVLITSALINWPHFMASYRLLYRSKDQITRYRWASLYVPGIIVFFCVYALVVPDDSLADGGIANRAVLDLFFLAGMMLLAWHYTGQAWGMTASYLYIAGIRINRAERWLIRSGYRALLVFHVLWVLVRNELTRALDLAMDGFLLAAYNVYLAWTVVCLVTIVLGIAGFVSIYRRTGQVPPLRAILPWAAIYLWYTLIFFCPGAFVFLQVSHALQYLAFPVRIEMNRYAGRRHANASQQAMHGALYYLALVAIGGIVYVGPSFASQFGDHQLHLSALVANSVNLHHYFVDGAIWKISNPSVRKDLFSHLSLE